MATGPQTQNGNGTQGKIIAGLLGALLTVVATGGFHLESKKLDKEVFNEYKYGVSEQLTGLKTDLANINKKLDERLPPKPTGGL